MTDARSHQLLKVASLHESAPVPQHSGFVDNRVQQLSIGPLIHHLILQISNIDRFKEHRSDPWLEKEPSSKIYSSYDTVITTFSSSECVKHFSQISWIVPAFWRASNKTIPRERQNNVVTKFFILNALVSLMGTDIYSHQFLRKRDKIMTFCFITRVTYSRIK